MKWAEFSVKASEKTLSVERVFNEALKNPITDREMLRSKKLYAAILKKQGKVRCVWTDRLSPSYDIDHLIPFSVWRNNDLWNLLSAQASVNNMKRDKILTPDLVERRRNAQTERFTKEMKIALLGSYGSDTWRLRN